MFRQPLGGKSNTISGHDHGVCLRSQQGVAGSGGVFRVFAVQAQAARLGHGHLVVKGPLLDGRGQQLHATASGAVRLGQHQHNFVPGRVQGSHGHLGEFGRARKYQTHAVLSARLFGL